MLAPLFTCGPAPRTLCSTLKALASALPITPPSLAINAWTRPSLFCALSSPTHPHAKTRQRTDTSSALRECVRLCCVFLPPRYRALATGAPEPLRALKSPSPSCRRTECFTPGHAPSQTERPGMLGLKEQEKKKIPRIPCAADSYESLSALAYRSLDVTTYSQGNDQNLWYVGRLYIADKFNFR